MVAGGPRPRSHSEGCPSWSDAGLGLSACCSLLLRSASDNSGHHGAASPGERAADLTGQAGGETRRPREHPPPPSRDPWEGARTWRQTRGGGASRVGCLSQSAGPPANIAGWTDAAPAAGPWASPRTQNRASLCPYSKAVTHDTRTYWASPVRALCQALQESRRGLTLRPHCPSREAHRKLAGDRLWVAQGPGPRGGGTLLPGKSLEGFPEEVVSGKRRPC